MIVMKFDFDKIFSLSYMGRLCHLQNFVLLLSYKEIIIVYCKLITHIFIYAYCGLRVYSI